MSQTRVQRLPGSRRAQMLAHLAAVAGCAGIFHPSDASAKAGSPVPPAGSAADAPPPWVRSDGFPPPRPFARTRAATPHPHTAVHPTAVVAPPTPLFPRAADVIERKAARRAAMERHPAGKALGETTEPVSGPGSTRPKPSPAEIVDRSTARRCSLTHRVRPGETLWGIASRLSGSERPIEILRLTLQIHRLNREVIGPDPDLILPGQMLTLPEGCER